MAKNYNYTEYLSSQLTKAGNLRRNMTKAERHLWYDYLKNHPAKFYRQRIIDRYIADFYCSSAKLVIELDGNQHYTDSGIEKDSYRTMILEKYGLYVLRFSNHEIEFYFEGVCNTIDRIINERKITG